MNEINGCAVVTGASRGLGLAISRALAESGRPVVMAARNADRLETAVSALRETGGEVLGYRADVTDEEAVDRLVGFALEEFGGIDVLVNSAGAPPLMETFGEGRLTWDEWRRHIDADLHGIFNGCRRVLPLMRAQGGGTIVNLSGGIHASSPHHVAYTPAKLAIFGFSRCVASDAAAAGVSVHCLCPDITIEGDVGRIGIETFAAGRGITRDEWLERFGPRPPSGARVVGEAVVELIGKPSGVWSVGGAGLAAWEAIAPPPRK